MNPDAFTKKCPQCGEMISGDESTCPKCGVSLRDAPVVCANCGKAAPGSAKFCPECGHALGRQEPGKKNAGQMAEKKNLNLWLPAIPLFILISFCLIVVVLGVLGAPSHLLVSGLGTVAAIGKPTLTPTATPTFTPSPTSTDTPTITPTPTLTPTPLPLPPATAKAKDTWVSPADGMEIVYIPEDHYVIGSLDSDPVAWIVEKPQHRVDLSGYWMDKTLVTNGMYAKCVQAGSCPAKIKVNSFFRDSYYGNSEFDDYPVVFVTWDEAQTYCTWAGRRLPTEAEWEVAARGRDERMYPWGNTPPNCSLVNFGAGVAKFCTGDTTAVGKYPQGASPYGLLDMAGNVWEWVADWLGPNYLAEPHQDPTGFSNGTLRVTRGGAYYSDAKYVRATFRAGHDPNDPTDYIGFRCAR